MQKSASLFGGCVRQAAFIKSVTRRFTPHALVISQSFAIGIVVFLLPPDRLELQVSTRWSAHSEASYLTKFRRTGLTRSHNKKALRRTRIFFAAGSTDMRKGFDGLQGVVCGVLEQDPLSGHLFLFVNRRRDKRTQQQLQQSQAQHAAVTEQFTQTVDEKNQQVAELKHQIKLLLQRIKGSRQERIIGKAGEWGHCRIGLSNEAMRLAFKRKSSHR